jgi:predicted RNase H-like HicB family nuclease
MDVAWNAEVVDQVASHWRLQLRPRLDGLTDHEYSWQTHFGGPPAHVANFDHAGTADEALRQLDDAFDHWVEDVRGLGEEGLAQPQGPTVPSEFAKAYLHAELKWARDAHSAKIEQAARAARSAQV